MSATLTPEQVSRLSLDERMKLIELIWATMVEEGEQVPTPEWHREVVRERVREYRQNPAQGTDAFEFLDKLGSGE